MPEPLLLLEELNRIGIALSAEKNHTRLLEMILDQAQRVTRADGGTLYLLGEDGTLRFELLHTASLGLRQGGSAGPVGLPAIALRDAAGEPNLHTVAARAALCRQTINIADVYADREFDFSGTRDFDRRTGYRSRSFLTVPMTDHENELIGVLQLLNAVDPLSGEVGVFSTLDQRVAESLASQAAIAITNKRLIEAQRGLFDALIQLVADAIDEKSPHTAGHCRRVPVLTGLLAEAACTTRSGPLADFQMTEAERYELDVAAWLHDCGKIATPEWVVDKATKLETRFDRIELIALRLHCVKQQLRLEALGADGAEAPPGLAGQERELDDALAFLRRVNRGGEWLAPADAERLRALAGRAWRAPSGASAPLLEPGELQNLLTERGTLNAEERAIIANHVAVTVKMLEELPYPKGLERVPEYAGGHHERLDGSGYPRGLTAERMSIPARMVAIADVFEALTAPDRPYKKAMTLSEALAVLGRMRLANHIDGPLFDVFVREKVYLRYAERCMDPAQIDAVDERAIPGYAPAQTC